MNEAHIIIGDECALFDKTKYQSCVRGTLQSYIHNGITLEPKEVLLTSCRDKSNWFYKRTIDGINTHYKSVGKPKVGFFAGDIITSVLNGIQSISTLDTLKRTNDEYTMLSEYFNVWLGDTKDSIFKYEQFNNARYYETAFYPQYLEYDFSNKEIEYNNDWNRIMSVDVAITSGKENDRTSIWFGKLNLETNELIYEYGVSFSGTNSVEQVKIIKRLFYQYQAEYCILDTKGLGAVLYDVLTIETFEDEFSLDENKFNNNSYPAWGATDDKSLQISSDVVLKDKLGRITTTEYDAVIVPYTGTRELNSQLHYSFWNGLRNKHIILLKSKSEIEQIIDDTDKTFFTRNSKEKADRYQPYLETDMLVNETMALNVLRDSSGLLSVKEASGKTKDRYMSASMLRLLADKLYQKRINNEDNGGYSIEDFEGLYG